MSNSNNSSTIENYLKAILSLSQQTGCGERVQTGDLAERLSVTSGTVTTMMKHLAARELVDYMPRQGIKLTSTGQDAATEVLRRHRLVELFLVEVMHLDWAEVDEEAEVLEHVVSDRMLARMDEMLGYPTHDPHGDPIPTKAGEIPTQELTPLAECEAGDYRIARILGDDPPFLNWLKERALVPGSALCVGERDDFAGTITVSPCDSTAPLHIGIDSATRLLLTPEV